MLSSLALSLLLTLLFEVLFALAWGLHGKRELAIVVLVNILTNPAVVLLYTFSVSLWGINPVVATLILECMAVVVEWLYYRSCSYQLKRPLIFAFLANAISYSAGHLIQLF